MANKIIILGSKGNLGSQLKKVFTSDGEVIGWDRGEIDITDKDLVIKKITDLKPILVINAAAYNAVDKCEQDNNEYKLAKKINSEAVGFLAKACLDIGAEFIHYSSDYVFGGKISHNSKNQKDIKRQGGYEESDFPQPINRYGLTKLLGEEEILRLSGKGLKWKIIRTSKLFGPKGESEVSKPSFFDIMLRLSQEKNEIDVVDNEISCFTYIVDLAIETQKLWQKNFGSGIYHIVNSGACSWYTAAKELFKLTGKKIKLNPIKGEQLSRPAKRPNYSVLKNTKIQLLRNYQEALKDFLIIRSSG